MNKQEVNVTATGPPLNGKGDAPEQRKCRRIPKELGKRTEHNVNKQLLPCRSSLVADLQTIPVSGFEVLPGAPAGYLRITPDIFGLSAFQAGSQFGVAITTSVKQAHRKRSNTENVSGGFFRF